MPDDIDDQLRTRLRSSFPREQHSGRLLASLTPVMRRARHHRQAGTAALTLAAFSLAGVGGAAFYDAADERERTEVIATTPAEITTPTNADQEQTERPERPATTDPMPTTTIDRPPATTTTVDQREQVDHAPGTPVNTIGPEDEPTTSAPRPTSPSTSTRPGGSPATTTPPAPSSTNGPPPSVPLPSTTQNPAATLVSTCGSITVRVNGDAISLVEIDPKPGFDVDEKNAGPEEVEVSFENETAHCEIKAEVEHDQLITEIENG